MAMCKRALLNAGNKLDRIIAKYGNDNGERLQPYYLNELIAEELRVELLKAELAAETVNHTDEKTGECIWKTECSRRQAAGTVQLS